MFKFKLLLFLLFIAACFLVGFFFLSKRPVGPITLAPRIPKLLKFDIPIVLTLSEDKFAFPASIPSLIIESKENFSEDSLKDAAKSLGFTQEPIRAEDAFDGTTYIWNESGKSIVAYPQKNNFEYSLDEKPRIINKQLTDDDLEEVATKALIDTGLVGAGDVEFSSFSYIQEVDAESFKLVTTKNDASYIQANFIPKDAGLKIITIDPNKTPYIVKLLTDGSVYKISITKIGKLTKSPTENRLKSYKEVLTTLGSATVVSLEDGNVNLPDIPENSIEKIEIVEIELAYLLDSSTAQILQPIYLLKGSAFPKNEAKVNTVLYLQAAIN